MSKKEDQEFVHDGGHFDDGKLQAVHNQLLREKAEPTELMTQAPIAILLFIASLLFFCGFYMGNYNADFRGDIFDETWGGDASGQVAAEFDPLTRGAKLFTRQCQQCHQADGMGLPGVYPPIAGSPWLLNSEERPVKLLLKGLSGPVTVLGKEFNGNMPAVADWKDRDIAAVLTYVRQNWSNDAGPISEELVTSIREEIKDRTKPWTSPEILSQHPL